MRFAVIGGIMLSPFAAVVLAAGPPNKPPAAKAPATAQAPGRVEFLRDIAPILARQGCSVAACHGKFGGRGGFQVSLLTLSPEDDYEPIVHGGRGRRVNFAAPEKSLILLKPTAQIAHGGGQRFPIGSPEYNTILRWIRQGAPFSDSDPRLASLAVAPARLALDRVGAVRQLRVVATYTDGSTRDVTRQTVYQSTNEASFEVSDDGRVTGRRWGGGAVIGRYLGTVVACFLTLPQARKGPYPQQPVTNPIDRLVFDNLRRLNVVPSGLCTDYEFLRRATLDTLGRLPTPDEIQAFTSSTAPDKRDKLVDALLAAPEFVDYRSMRLADLLRVNPTRLGVGALADRSADLMYEWIHDSVAANKPWNTFVRELLTARGSTYQSGPACFYRIETAPPDRMETVGQAFLGVRMACARCHKNPFDRWTTDDYWNFAAFMGKVGIGRGKLYDEYIIASSPGAAIVNESVLGPNRGKVAKATYLGDKQPAADRPDPVAGLADWVTAPANPWFARAAVNRLWSWYLGKGVVNPVDDMRATTPESVPGLLDALAGDFVKSGYDVKHVIRLIMASRTYQLSSLPNATNRQDDRFFSHFMPHPMPAQVFVDMVNEAAGARERYGSFAGRERAVQAALPVSNYFLDAFGRSHREFLSELDPKLEPNLVQTLHMIDSPYVDNKIRAGTTVAEVLKTAKTQDAVIHDLYLRTFCRPPTPAEVQRAGALIKDAKTPKEGAEDLLWALLSAREFYFNH